VAAVAAATTAAIISSIALRTASDAQLPLAIFSARALSSRLDRPCCRGIDDLVLAPERVHQGDQRAGCRTTTGWCARLEPTVESSVDDS